MALQSSKFPRFKSGIPGYDELVDGGFHKGTVNTVLFNTNYYQSHMVRWKIQEMTSSLRLESFLEDEQIQCATQFELERIGMSALKSPLH
ncbi:MAG: hypothetical protein ACYDHX_13445 [Methanothrix sp.]